MNLGLVNVSLKKIKYWKAMPDATETYGQRDSSGALEPSASDSP